MNKNILERLRHYFHVRSWRGVAGSKSQECLVKCPCSPKPLSWQVVQGRLWKTSRELWTMLGFPLLRVHRFAGFYMKRWLLFSEGTHEPIVTQLTSWCFSKLKDLQCGFCAVQTPRQVKNLPFPGHHVCFTLIAPTASPSYYCQRVSPIWLCALRGPGISIAASPAL